MHLFVEMPHVRVSKKFLRKTALDFRGKFFYDQIIRRINGQFHKFKGGGKPLQVNNTDKTNRFTMGGEKSKHIVPFNSSNIPDINVVTTILPSGLVP